VKTGLSDKLGSGSRNGRFDGGDLAVANGYVAGGVDVVLRVEDAS
jgi:hypothetical protein